MVHGEEKATQLYEKENVLAWPPWGCKMFGYAPKEKINNT